MNNIEREIENYIIDYIANNKCDIYRVDNMEYMNIPYNKNSFISIYAYKFWFEDDIKISINRLDGFWKSLFNIYDRIEIQFSQNLREIIRTYVEKLKEQDRTNKIKSIIQ